MGNSQYKILKEDKQWDDWCRSTIATIRSYTCDEILDPKYKSKNKDYGYLLIEKQKFVCSVFVEFVQTDMGKHNVRMHEKDSDLQSIFKKLSDYATESTQTTLESSNLLTYITTTIFTDSN